MPIPYAHPKTVRQACDLMHANLDEREKQAFRNGYSLLYMYIVNAFCLCTGQGMPLVYDCERIAGHEKLNQGPFYENAGGLIARVMQKELLEGRHEMTREELAKRVDVLQGELNQLRYDLGKYEQDERDTPDGREAENVEDVPSADGPVTHHCAAGTVPFDGRDEADLSGALAAETGGDRFDADVKLPTRAECKKIREFKARVADQMRETIKRHSQDIVAHAMGTWDVSALAEIADARTTGVVMAIIKYRSGLVLIPAYCVDLQKAAKADPRVIAELEKDAKLEAAR